MDRSDEIASELPAPRNDEPESLRCDILDELTDHLQCAFHRELHTQAGGGRQATDSDSESTARDRALSRFGNPAAVARRLWFDAMKEKIMNQRITMTAAIVMACACLGMLGIVMQIRGDADAAAQQREQFQALLVESQELNRELAETVTNRLSEMEGIEGAEFSDWNPVELWLVHGTEDGTPAVGFSVQMVIETYGNGIPPMTAQTDATGVVRFDRVRYGNYDVTIRAPWDEVSRHWVTLQPGESHQSTIVCPMAAPQPLQAELAIEWPEDLANRPIFMEMSPWNTYRVIDGNEWSTSAGALSRPSQRRPGGSRSLFVSPSGVIHYHRSAYGRFDEKSIFVEPTESDSAVRMVQWRGADYSAGGIRFYVPRTQTDRARYRNGEPLSDDTGMVLIENAAIGRNELQWRVEDGSPDRIVYVPPAATVTAVREFLAALDAGADVARDTRQAFRDQESARFALAQLPPPLTSIQAATEP